MTHDFKAVLKIFDNGAACANEYYWTNKDEIEAIQAALRLAHRLQSGEVSKGMEDKGSHLRFLQDDKNYKHTAAIFTEMAKQMLKEIEEELKRCPKCGYNRDDAILHGDHNLCENKHPPWSTRSTPSITVEELEGLDEALPAAKNKWVDEGDAIVTGDQILTIIEAARRYQRIVQDTYTATQAIIEKLEG